MKVYTDGNIKVETTHTINLSAKNVTDILKSFLAEKYPQFKITAISFTEDYTPGMSGEPLDYGSKSFGGACIKAMDK